MARSYKSIYSALIANVVIAIIKFVAGGFSNSSAMISEGIHSMVDTINQVLLLFGIRRSQKPPDAQRPFGYGKELYFWAFIVSILIFGLGGGLTIYQGVLHIIHPQELGDPTWNYVVLGLSFLFDGASFVIAIKEFNKSKGELSYWQAIIKSKDPSGFLVLFEDGAAVLGLTVVFVLMLISHAIGVPELDGVASVLVGLILVFTSSILARESYSLLMGEGVANETQDRIMALVNADRAVEKVLTVMSTYESPEEVLLMLVIRFKPSLHTEELTEAIERIRANVKQKYELIQYVIIQPKT